MFVLDLRSRAPIYEQLVDKFIELIVSHVLEPDERLPAVRTLASELTINPNTIHKAYRELEHRGFIYSIPGKGSFVKGAVPGDHRLRLNLLEKELTRVVHEMLYLGAGREEISRKVSLLLNESEGEKKDDFCGEGD